MSEVVRLHIKVLVEPKIAIEQMIRSMEEVYNTAGILIEVVSTEKFNLPHLNDVEIGLCVEGSTTEEQNLLFSHRDSVGVNELVAYFVRATIPDSNGCAAHPNNLPGVVITEEASQWTLAHEIGHVLGLSHVNDNNRLMTKNGTHNITNAPPDLTPEEILTMQNSDYTI
ncbi:matrixin family metalloprotease [Bacillus cereus]|nr:matrixin family metalloprotease [Bacillus cereus]MED3312903.1 matrixin family metalloprotease [Bacillus thuringiensis]